MNFRSRGCWLSRRNVLLHRPCFDRWHFSTPHETKTFRLERRSGSIAVSLCRLERFPKCRHIYKEVLTDTSPGLNFRLGEGGAGHAVNEVFVHEVVEIFITVRYVLVTYRCFFGIRRRWRRVVAATRMMTAAYSWASKTNSSNSSKTWSGTANSRSISKRKNWRWDAHTNLILLSDSLSRILSR